MTGVLPISPPLLLALGVLLGSVMGSYFATVLWRMPRGASANRGRSECDSCATPLPWKAILPLVGFFVTRGKCRHCGGRITRQHLTLELACAFLGGLVFLLGKPLLAPLIWLLLVLAMFDALYLWLPNRIVALTACAALLAPPPDAVLWGERFAGGAAGFGVFWLVAKLYRIFRGRVGLGGGDIKLFGAIGLWCGLWHMPTILLGATTIGTLYYLALRVNHLADFQTRLPLGTFLSVWTVVFALGMSASEISSLADLKQIRTLSSPAIEFSRQ